MSEKLLDKPLELPLLTPPAPLYKRGGLQFASPFTKGGLRGFIRFGYNSVLAVAGCETTPTPRNFSLNEVLDNCQSNIDMIYSGETKALRCLRQ